MSDVNQVNVSGRLARKPEKRVTPSGTPLCDFTIANNRYSRNGQEYTTWCRCVVWNKPAEYIAGLDKGDHVFVTGQLVDDDYETTKGDPSTKTKGRLKIDNCKVTVLHRKSKPENQAEQPSETDSPGETVSSG